MDEIAKDLFSWIVLLLVGVGWYFAKKGRKIREAKERAVAVGSGASSTEPSYTHDKAPSSASRVVRYKDVTGSLCFAVLELKNGDPIFISIAQSGILVKRSKLGILGARLYDEKVIYRAAMTAKALAALYPVGNLPSGMKNPVLRAFANAALACGSAAEVTHLFNEAVSTAEKLHSRSISEIEVGPI